MNGKLIYKRKRDEQVSSTISEDTKRERIDHECQNQQTKPSVISGNQNTPPPSPVPVPIHREQAESRRNIILLEALQKIVELQKELDDFENDLDYSDEQGLLDEKDDDSEISFYLNEHQQQARGDWQRNEAEALGFAICARETLMFLQQEGISQDSLVYRSLREKLVGSVAKDIPI